ncbi:MAG TPA: collagen-binding domain-containing protein [Verrucomicrobiae bacterium]|jgi:hypothetical protein|nr:collagen-binding domain-containing protein [Verrucomicrobiae bacterium]
MKKLFHAVSKMYARIKDAAHRAEKGFILTTVYGLLAVMAIFSLALFSRNINFLSATERNQNKVVAFNMAESAVDLALTQLGQDPAYAGTGYISMSAGAMQGGYDVTVTTPGAHPDIRLIQATGYAPDNSAASRAQENRGISVYAQITQQSYFDFAVFSKEGMHINGGPTIDSYDSSLGAYGGGNAGQNGDIGTDSTGSSTVGVENTINIDGNAVIKGDVMVGPGANPDNVIDLGHNVTLTGTKGSEDYKRDYEPITSNATNLGALSLSGSTTQYLGPGTYHYSSLSISGQAKLIPTGPVVIYVDGAVSIGGNGVATSSNLPPNFLLYAASTSVAISGNGNFYGGVYAPNADVSVSGNGQIFGGLVGKTYHQTGNANIHYDEALKNTGGSANGPITVKSWQEKNTTAWQTTSSGSPDGGG